MSLIRPIIRWTACAALRNATWAENRVLDSSNTPLVDMLVSDVPRPYIVVYTDADTAGVMGRDVWQADRNISLVFEMGLAAGILVEGTNRRQIQIPATDEGKEVAVDIIESQTIAALLGNPRNPWCELFKNLVFNIIRAPSVRGGASDGGVRWAARQLTFVCVPIADVLPTEVLDADHPIKQFIALAKSDRAAGMDQAATLVEKVMETTEMEEWVMIAAKLGLTNAGIRGIGLAPLVIADIAQSPLTNVDPTHPDPSFNFDPPVTDASEYEAAYNQPV